MSARAEMTVALMAGGTGGHMVPAYTLALELRRRGHRTLLLTDDRGASVPALFRPEDCIILKSGHMTGGLLTKAGAIARILRNILIARRILQRARPDIAIGFGGYPALAGLLAARSLGIPICLHEQNAVLGRVNRLLGRVAAAIALSFPETQRLPASLRPRGLVTGNPVRPEVARLARTPYPRLDEEHMLRLLVVGGSLGARVLSDVAPDGLALLPPHLKRRLQVTQQCRAEDIERVRRRYQDAGIAAELSVYLKDLPERLQWTHLVISRAGASTLAELSAAGRPGIFVPLPIATDDHQSVNARIFADQGAGWLIAETDFSPSTLAKAVQRLALDPARLVEAAEKARLLGAPDAASALADMIEELSASNTASHEDRAGRRRDGDAGRGETREMVLP